MLEEEEYQRRKLFYQLSGQRHYYFMNVGNGEVIDACRKVGCSSHLPAVLQCIASHTAVSLALPGGPDACRQQEELTLSRRRV